MKTKRPRDERGRFLPVKVVYDRDKLGRFAPAPKRDIPPETDDGGHLGGLAKPMTPGEHLSPRFKDMFPSLVPVQIQSSLANFDSRRSEIINLETDRLREYTQIMNTRLASLNLPAAFDDVTNHEKLAESIRQKSAKVKSEGGIVALDDIIAQLPDAFKRNDEILNETARLLKEENDTDQNLRTQFQEKWTRMASSALTSPLTQELGKYRGILHTASNAVLYARSLNNTVKDLSCLARLRMSSKLLFLAWIALQPVLDPPQSKNCVN